MNNNESARRIDPAGDAVPPAAGSGGAVVVSWPLDVPRRAWRRLRGGAVLAFARLVDLVGALGASSGRRRGAPDVRRAALAPATGR